MKIAVLCLAYLGSGTGIRRLAEYFAPADADLYVHIDVATDLTDYAAAAADHSHVHLFEERRRCWWGGFNGARTVLNMLRHAGRRGEYDRYLYITEDTLPLRSRRQLKAAFAAPVDYIAASTSNVIRDRYEGFYYVDCAAMNPRTPAPNFNPLPEEVDPFLRRLAARREHGKTRLTELWQGCCHWALRGSTAAALLARHDGDTQLRESFEFSMIPEEMYYHTILGLEGFLGERTPPCVFQDFSRDPRPFVYRHRDEFDALRSNEALFARKVALDSPDYESYIRDLARR